MPAIVSCMGAVVVGIVYYIVIICKVVKKYICEKDIYVCVCEKCVKRCVKKRNKKKKKGKGVIFLVFVFVPEIVKTACGRNC